MIKCDVDYCFWWQDYCCTKCCVQILDGKCADFQSDQNCSILAQQDKEEFERRIKLCLTKKIHSVTV